MWKKTHNYLTCYSNCIRQCSAGEIEPVDDINILYTICIYYVYNIYYVYTYLSIERDGGRLRYLLQGIGLHSHGAWLIKSKISRADSQERKAENSTEKVAL